jgi:anti-sigma regulatory factor (Ser/Thr protein kinase)
MPKQAAVPTVEDRFWLPVDDLAAAGGVRRAAAALGIEAGLSEGVRSSLALIATEMATNLARHADEGMIVLRLCRVDDRRGVEIAAFDRGPGIANLEQSTRDGYSTGGTLGIGLGAIGRMATTVDTYTQPGRGTVLVASVWEPSTVDETWMSGVSRPMPGETMCGDGFAGRNVDGRRQLLLCDGLGHGSPAALASQAVMRAFAGAPNLGPKKLLEYVHDRIRGTRGAVVAVADLDPEVPTVRFAGVGNIAAFTMTDGQRKVMVSLPGIVGHQVREMREFTYVLPAGGLLVLHSDGLSDRWDAADYPGLTDHSPAVIALTLLRDAAKRRDDAAIIVARAQ